MLSFKIKRNFIKNLFHITSIGILKRNKIFKKGEMTIITTLNGHDVKKLFVAVEL